MPSPRTQRIVAFSLSVVGHALIVVALTFSVSLSSPERPMGVIVPIQTVMVDQTVLDARDARIEAERQAALRQQQEAARQRQREEQLVRERAAAAEQAKIQLEAERRAAEAEMARLEEERIRQEEEQARRAEEEARRLEAERQERIAQERAEAERRRREEELERQRQQIAADIAAAAAAEQQANAAASSGARAQWAAAISNKVQRNWQRPLNATAGLECLLVVEQLITGDVRSVTVRECNVSDANIIRSLENAVQASSPLPARPPGVQFEPVVRITFRPTD
jgi:membrane protein involved in colicin uptake